MTSITHIRYIIQTWVPTRRSYIKAEREGDIEQYLQGLELESLQIVHRYKNLIDLSIANLRIYGHILVRSNEALKWKKEGIKNKWQKFYCSKKI